MAPQQPVILLSRELPELFTTALTNLGEVRVAGSQPDEASLPVAN